MMFSSWISGLYGGGYEGICYDVTPRSLVDVRHVVRVQ
jgi:hypothetical protein